MDKFLQPKVTPLPTGIDLTGKTAVVTGASSGLGLELTRQLLQMRASTVILAVRNIAKGEACAKDILQGHNFKKLNPKPSIKVMELDMDRYGSVQQFANQLRDEIPVVDLLILNAGISPVTLERSPNGHSRAVQVNYLSNVLLIAELLPYLQAGAEKTGSPARVSWVGSRMHESPSLEKKMPMKADEGVLEHLDKEETFVPFQHYGDSKLLCAPFMYSLTPKLDPKKVIINMVCPGMVNTALSDALPSHVRLVANAIKAIRAHSVDSVDKGAWLILNAALVEGSDSHGRFLGDKIIME